MKIVTSGNVRYSNVNDAQDFLKKSNESQKKEVDKANLSASKRMDKDEKKSIKSAKKVGSILILSSVAGVVVVGLIIYLLGWIDMNLATAQLQLSKVKCNPCRHLDLLGREMWMKTWRALRKKSIPISK